MPLIERAVFKQEDQLFGRWARTLCSVHATRTSVVSEPSNGARFDGVDVLAARHRGAIRHLILTPLYPPARFGGIEKIVQQLAERIAAVGDDVAVFAFDPERDTDTVGGATYVRRVRCPITSGSLPAIEAGQAMLIDAVLSHCGDRGAPFVIHAHDWFVGGAALTLRAELRAPVVAFFHSDKRAEYGNRLVGDRERVHALQKHLAVNADAVLCYSRFMQRCLAASFAIDPDCIGLFRCGLDEGVDRRREQPHSEPRVLLYLGRLAPEKDVGTLLAAFREDLDSMSACRLRIVGDGSECDRLKRDAARLGLDGCVEFRPFTARPEDVDAELRAAWALVLPSVFEPFGLVVLEAISRGVPVVVPAMGGPAEVITDQVTGWTFQPGDHRQLAAGLRACLADAGRAEAVAEAAHRMAAVRFRWTGAASSVRAVCRDLLATGARPGVSK